MVGADVVVAVVVVDDSRGCVVVGEKLVDAWSKVVVVWWFD